MRAKFMKEILLTGFCGTSSELIVNKAACKSLVLPNDKVLDSQILLAQLGRHDYRYIFSFGQKPNIKDKVYIETTARKGSRSFYTDFAYDKLQEALKGEKYRFGFRIMSGNLFVILYTGMCWNIFAIRNWIQKCSFCMFHSV